MKTRSVPSSKIKSWFPTRPRQAHKGRMGRVLIIAGNRGMTGAGALCSGGAMRVGAGLVKWVVPQSQQPIAAKRAPLEVTTQGVPEAKSGTFSPQAWPSVKKIIQKFEPHVVALGPGIGQTSAARAFVRRVIKGVTLPMVLDADGLNAFSGHAKELAGHPAPLIITPHPGEMKRLLQGVGSKILQSREAAVKELVRRTGAIAVLKGAGTLVSFKGKTFKNPTGNAGMASGGTGDVLTGMIAGVWGQYPTQNAAMGFRAAVVGTYIHGRAGDLAAKKTTKAALLASDLVQFIPQAIISIKRRI